MNDSCLEHLGDLLRQQVDQVVHVVDGLSVFDILPAPLRNDLLVQQENEILKIGVAGEILVFLGELHAHLDLVEDSGAHREDESLALPHRRIR